MGAGTTKGERGASIPVTGRGYAPHSRSFYPAGLLTGRPDAAPAKTFQDLKRVHAK